MEDYEPLGDLLTDEVQFPVVNILLFGSVGAGKSSVYNTINSVFRKKIFNVARSGNAEHSLTTKVSVHVIKRNKMPKILQTIIMLLTVFVVKMTYGFFPGVTLI